MENFQNQKIQTITNTIESIASQLATLLKLLKIEDGTHFRVILLDDFSYVDIWDSENESPRILVACEEKIPQDIFLQFCCRALTFLSPRAKRKPVFWRTNLIEISDLPKDFHEFKDVFRIQESNITQDEIQEIKAEYYATNYLSKLNEVQGSH